MKTKLTIDDFKGMLVRALEMIREREDEFSRLDAIIGDGDHGQAIVAAMTASCRVETPSEHCRV